VAITTAAAIDWRRSHLPCILGLHGFARRRQTPWPLTALQISGHCWLCPPTVLTAVILNEDRRMATGFVSNSSQSAAEFRAFVPRRRTGIRRGRGPQDFFRISRAGRAATQHPDATCARSLGHVRTRRFNSRTVSAIARLNPAGAPGSGVAGSGSNRRPEAVFGRFRRSTLSHRSAALAG
jgi:hypothetical protein